MEASNTPNKKEKKMKALEFRGNKQVEIRNLPIPKIVDQKDVVIRVTSTTVCGSDLHLYHSAIPGMHVGDVLGHEFMGIIDEVGNQVQNLKKGDRVVVSAIIAEGECWFCQRELFSCCDRTNSSQSMEKMYGHRTAGIFGYSHMMGGYQGGQAEYVRVPYADVNCLKAPVSIPDEKVLFLSDIVCTGWHAVELGEVSEKEGYNTVAVFGCGPVGLMAVAWARFRGARRIIAVDNIPERLEMAKKAGAEIINFNEEDTIKAFKRRFPSEPGGPDVCIDAVGFRYCKTLKHIVETSLLLESDSCDVITEAVTIVRKGGTLCLIGDYVGHAHHFPIGALMEKAIQVRGGQVPVQRYWKKLLGYIEQGRFDPRLVISHRMDMDDLPVVYEKFDDKQDGMVKALVQTEFGKQQECGRCTSAEIARSAGRFVRSPEER